MQFRNEYFPIDINFSQFVKSIDVSLEHLKNAQSSIVDSCDPAGIVKV